MLPILWTKYQYPEYIEYVTTPKEKLAKIQTKITGEKSK